MADIGFVGFCARKTQNHLFPMLFVSSVALSVQAKNRYLALLGRMFIK